MSLFLLVSFQAYFSRIANNLPKKYQLNVPCIKLAQIFKNFFVLFTENLIYKETVYGFPVYLDIFLKINLRFSRQK